MEYVRDSSKNLRLLSELLLNTPVSAPSATEKQTSPSLKSYSDHSLSTGYGFGPK